MPAGALVPPSLTGLMVLALPVAMVVVAVVVIVVAVA